MKKIYIVSEAEKESFLTSLSQKTLENRSVYTLDDINKIYPYIHDDKALDYIINKCHVCLDVAQIYLKQILYYKVENLSTKKGLFLSKLKEELLNNHLLVFNRLFYEQLKSSSIQCYIPYSKDLEQFFKGVKINYILKSKKSYPLEIFEMENKEQEIAFVGEKIKELLKNGVDINSIYVCNLDDDYRGGMQRIFKWQQINFLKKNSSTLSMTPCGSKFLKYLKSNDILDALKCLQNNLKVEDTLIYNQIVDLVNNTVLLRHQKEFLIYDLEHTKVKQENVLNVVKEISLEEIFEHENDYVFLLQAISSLLPKTYKDEDYLNDQEKDLLQVDTSLDKNRLAKELALNALNSCSHLFITYPKVKNGKECYLSSLLTPYKDIIKKGNSLTFLASDFFNQMYLSQELDDYVKYNTISKECSFLSQHYKLDYGTYDHRFTKVPYQANHVFLSYTSLDKYLKCPFAYYISSILKLNPDKDTFSIFVGNLFHKVLEEYFKGNKDFAGVYDLEVQKHSFDCKEKFFLEKLKKDLAFIIKTIDEQDKHSLLDSLKTEEKIVIEIPGNIEITFQGKIDKIKYKETDSSLVIVLIDYKTGNTSMKKSYMPLGFHLQLPIYLFLTSTFHKKVEVGGIYLQNILPSRINYDEKSTLEAQKKKALKLQGYSNSCFNILEMVDDSYVNSEVIASLRVKQDHNFYANSKVMDEQDILTLKELARTKIIQTGQNIALGNFEIAPKVVDEVDQISCKFCKFKDLCYHTYKDSIYLKSDKKFLVKEDCHGVD